MVHSRQITVSSFHRDAWVEIDLSAIEENVRIIRSWTAKGGDDRSSAESKNKADGKEGANSKANTKSAGGAKTRLMGVVKSDAYGHGAPAVAQVLEASGAEWLGVASVDEGSQLREAGIKSPIMILSPTPLWAIENALADELDLTVASSSELHDIERAAKRHNKKAHVHLKVDSGMHRLGARPQAVKELVDLSASLKNLKLVSLFSHLARAADEATTMYQLQTFRKAIDSIFDQSVDRNSTDSNSNREAQFLIHLASSEATRWFPGTHLDMVRVGLYIYGLEPKVVPGDLRPAMSVRARINHINMIPKGDSAGYNLTWKAERDSRLASIPIGYADGVDRRLSNRISAFLLGHEIKQAGLISMDQMLFDITDVPEAQLGDVVTLVGSEQAAHRTKKGTTGCIYLADWAQMLDTITYELACRLRARLPRIYTRHHHAQMNSSKTMASTKEI